MKHYAILVRRTTRPFSSVSRRIYPASSRVQGKLIIESRCIAAVLRRDGIIFAVAALSVVFLTAGFAVYPMVRPAPVGPSEGVSLVGYVTIQAYNPEGVLYASWQGHNSISPVTFNAMAACLSGNSTAPDEYGSCSGLTPKVYASEVAANGSSYGDYGTATNSLQPAGCHPVGNPPNCDGWTAEGVITFTYGGFPGQVTMAGAASGYTLFDFATVSPPITVSRGNMLVVSVTFTFS